VSALIAITMTIPLTHVIRWAARDAAASGTHLHLPRRQRWIGDRQRSRCRRPPAHELLSASAGG
jgi:hypothetical protein